MPKPKVRVVIDRVDGMLVAVIPQCGRAYVQSGQGKPWYRLTDDDCGCPGFAWRRQCKHVRAVSRLMRQRSMATRT